MDEVWTWMGCGHGWSVDGAWTRIGWQDRASMYMRFPTKKTCIFIRIAHEVGANPTKANCTPGGLHRPHLCRINRDLLDMRHNRCYFCTKSASELVLEDYWSKERTRCPRGGDDDADCGHTYNIRIKKQIQYIYIYM